MENSEIIFPFNAIIGQEEMKTSLIINIIDPKIGGVLIMGDRGTGKSTIIRSIVDLLPNIKVVVDDPFNSDPQFLKDASPFVLQKLKCFRNVEISEKVTPFINLPLNATEDCVCGTINLEKAIKEGIKDFEPGLLASAHRGILYVDEINLLDDHLVDILLDVTASGWNIVEREGISFKHKSDFIFIGSGNPEEGELRPQLLDRFGLNVQVKTTQDPQQRVEIVKQKEYFNRLPEMFYHKYLTIQTRLARKLIVARNLLDHVKIDPNLCLKISNICTELEIDGLRGDIIVNRAAKALACFEQRNEVNVNDIYNVIGMCLRHRLRKDPLEVINFDEKIYETFKKIFAD